MTSPITFLLPPTNQCLTYKTPVSYKCEMNLKSLNSPNFLGSMANVSFGVVQFLMISLYPLLAINLKIDLATIILTFSLGSFCFVFASPFWAHQSNHLGRQRVITIGLIGLCISFFILILISTQNYSSETNLFILILSRLIYGLTASAIVTTVQLWWKDSKGDETKKMLNHSMSLNLGRLIAPLLVILTQGQLIPVLWIIGVCTFLLGIIFSVQPSQSITSSNSSKFTLKLDRVHKTVFVSTLFIGLIHSNLASEIMKKFSLTSEETSLLTSKLLILSSITAFISQIVARSYKSTDAKKIIKLGFSSWVLAGVFFAILTHELNLWLAVTFFSIGLALFLPGLLVYQKTSSEIGTTNSLQTLGLSLGGLVGWVVVKDYLPLSVLITLLLVMIFILKRRVYEF